MRILDYRKCLQGILLPSLGRAFGLWAKCLTCSQFLFVYLRNGKWGFFYKIYTKYIKYQVTQYLITRTFSFRSCIGKSEYLTVVYSRCRQPIQFDSVVCWLKYFFLQIKCMNAQVHFVVTHGHCVSSRHRQSSLRRRTTPGDLRNTFTHTGS